MIQHLLDFLKKENKQVLMFNIKPIFIKKMRD